MSTIKVLDSDTIRHINSGQVITTIDVIIKELLENSLDASATNIEIKLINNGLHLIEIKDNGSGILLEDRLYIGKQHYTSKISNFKDIEKLSSFGFRGEALHALCTLAEVHITTKTKKDNVAICYKLDHNGDIKSETPSGNISSSGTIVTIIKPFYNIPVRKQIAEKSKLSTINRVQELVIKYSLSHPTVRLSLNQSQGTIGQVIRQPIWIKPTTKCLLDGIRMIYGRELASMLEEFQYHSTIATSHESNNDGSSDDDDDFSMLKLNCLLPTKNSDPNVVFKNDNVFVYVNQRPISYYKSNLKELVAMVRQRYKQVLGLSSADNVKSPFMYIDIQSPLGTFDVNVEPDKTIVIFLNKQKILNTMEQLLDQFYGSFFNNTLSHSVQSFLEQRSQTPISPPNITLHEEGYLTDKHNKHQTTEITGDNIVGNDKHTINEVDGLESDDYNESSLFTMDKNKSTLETTMNNSGNKILDVDHYNHDYNSNVNSNNIILQSNNLYNNDMGLSWQIDDDTNGSTEVTNDHCINNESILYPNTGHRSNTLSVNWFDQFRRNQPSIINSNNNKRINTPLKRPLTHVTTKEAHPVSSIINNENQQKRSRVQTNLDDHIIHTTPSQLPFSISHSSDIFAQVNFRNDNEDSSVNNQHTDITNSDSKKENVAYNKDFSTLSPTALVPSSLQHPLPIKNFSIFGSTPKRRDIASILNSTSPALSSSFTSSTPNIEDDQNESLTCTLNKITVIDTPYNIEQLSEYYNQFRHRYSYFYKKSLNEYHQQVNHYLSNKKNTSYQSSLITCSDYFPPNKEKDHKNIRFITQNINTEVGWLSKAIGAVNMKKLFQKYQFQKYMDDYILDCNSTLDDSVQLKISKDNVLYNTVISLNYQEKHDDNDLMYSEIIDSRITSNGFHVQWRIDSTTEDLIINITSIFALKGYGLVDFKELLALIQRKEHQKSHDKTLSKIRPSKVVDYFRKLADNNNSNKNENTLIPSHEILEKLLPNWDKNEKKINTMNDSLVYILM